MTIERYRRKEMAGGFHSEFILIGGHSPEDFPIDLALTACSFEEESSQEENSKKKKNKADDEDTIKLEAARQLLTHQRITPRE